MKGWEPTGRGGFRRTGVAQEGSLLPGQSTGLISRRSSGSNPSPRTKWAVKWHENLGLPDCPYVIRWRIETPVGSVRLHHWLGPDDDRAYHDHPWWFLTFVLRGGYTDRHPGWRIGLMTSVEEEHLRAPAVRYRPALHRHTVIPDPGGAWTVLITGPRVRNWGFWLNGKFRKANKWFATHGHHPCA